MDYSLDRLKVFNSVVKEKSFKSAAEKLGLQPSTVSHTISNLEKEFGFLLMKRGKGGIALSAEGKRLYDFMADIFSTLDTLEEYLTSANLVKGELNIATWYGLGNYLIINYVIKFIEKYPDTKINIIGNNGFGTDFDSYGADVCVLPYFEDREDLVQVKIYSTSFCAYASKGYIEKYGMPEKFSDLDNHRLLSASKDASGPFKIMDWHLIKGRENDNPREPFLIVNSSTGLAKYCLNDMGIVTLPPYYANSFEGDLVKLFPDYNPSEIDFYYIYPKYAKHLKKITAFADFLSKDMPKSKEAF